VIVACVARALAVAVAVALVMAGLTMLAGGALTARPELSEPSARIITVLAAAVAVGLSGAVAAASAGTLPEDLHTPTKIIAAAFAGFFVLMTAGILIAGFRTGVGLTGRQADIEILVGQAVLSILAVAAQRKTKEQQI
jgi:hypothetical protein